MTMEEVYVPGQAIPSSQPGPSGTRPGFPGTIKPRKGPGGRRPEPKKAANDELPPAANDEDYLEEVKVTGKSYARWLDAFSKAFRRGWPGFDSVLTPAQLAELYQEQLNELTEQDAKTQPEIEEAIQNGDPLEEVFVTAPAPQELPISQPASVPDYYTKPPIEEIVIKAKKIKHGAAHTVEIGWPELELFFNHYWTPPVRQGWDHGYKPGKNLPEPRPQIAPKKPPKVNPDSNPDDTPLGDLAGNPYISVGIALSLKPQQGIQIRTVKKLEPAARREENKVRRDRKEQHAARRYRAVLRVFNMTFGTATEVLDFWNIIADNITVGGKLLSQWKDPIAALKWAAESGQWDVDMDQALIDLLQNQTQDKMIGRAAQLQRQALNEMGYYGPNAGSYLPDYEGTP